MNTGTTRTKPSGTYITHFFGRGLEDQDRYDVQRFQSMTSGEIRAVKASGDESVSCGTVRGMRPARNEIIICTARRAPKSGVQFWGALATGLFYAGAAKA